MAIRKKNTRLINCNGRKFRWKVSPSGDFIKFVAEGFENNGRKIEVLVKSDINRLWTECPNVSDLNLQVIMPKDAAFFISNALENGWDPEEKGVSIKYRLLADQLFKDD
jgi:hypothetical protein